MAGDVDFVAVLGFVVEGITVEATAVENLPFLVVDGDHLEQLLLVTSSSAGHAFTPFQPGRGQFRFRDYRPGAVEIRSQIIHGDAL